MAVVLIALLSVPVIYVALEWDELIHNGSPISSKVGTCGTVRDELSSLEDRFIAAECTPGDNSTVFYIHSVGESRTCTGDLMPLTGRSSSRFSTTRRTVCLAPLLAEGACYTLLGPGPYQSLRLRRAECGVEAYARVDRVIRGTTDRSRCRTARFTLSYTRPMPIVYCMTVLRGDIPGAARRPRATTIPVVATTHPPTAAARSEQ